MVMNLFSLIKRVPIVGVSALVVWIWWQLALVEENMDWYVYIIYIYIHLSCLFLLIFNIVFSPNLSSRI